MNKKDLSNIIVLLICFVIITLPFLGKNNAVEEYNQLDELFFKRNITSSAIIVIYFIINYYIFIPKIYFKRKYFIYIALFFLGLIGIYYIPSFVVSSEEINNLIQEFHSNKSPAFRGRSILEKPFFNQKAFLYYLTFTIALILRTHKQMQEMEQIKIQSELSYLKAQINPHFLFNTLNSIYALSLMKSDLTPKAILKLSSLMRYTVTESEKNEITIEQEINYLEDYIELQKIRIDNNSSIQFKISIENKSFKIAPMILIPFVENAFKYGINPAKEANIKVEITQKENELEFYCFNEIIFSDLKTIEKTGTGIKNTNKRLESIYGSNQQLTINETEDTFIVKLKIKK